MTRRILFLMIVLLLTGISAAAQSATGTASAGKKAAKSADEERREQKRYRAKRTELAKKLTPAAIKRAQSDKAEVMPMEFLGRSEQMAELAKRKVPPVPKENGPVEDGEEGRKESLRILKSLARPSVIDGTAFESFLQTDSLTPFAPIAGTSFDGPGKGIAGYIITGAPPDTSMAVGPNHIVAWVNSHYMVFNKSGTPLLPAPGFLAGNALFAGLPAGSLCKDYNRGDPILQYDRLADRWILSQFAFNAGFTQNAQCFAISTTNDPTGSYFLYQLSFGNVLPDYGKIGIWNDAYYTSYNMFTTGSAFAGDKLCASDRTKMLVGDPTASTICFGSISRFSFLPADLDGSTLPSDTTRGGLFLGWNWAFLAAPPYSLQVIRLKPDFLTPANSTIGNGFGGATNSVINIPVSGIAPCNDSGTTAGLTCVSQPETTQKLDTLGDRHMYRLAYRNRGGVDSLVVTQSVDPDGAGARSSALRWYEIRNPLGNPNVTTAEPFIHQSGTFDPGASGDRWMGSTAMNKYGDILTGYSVVNVGTALKPSIAVAGRSQSDTLGTLQAEQIAQTGTGSQTGSLERWGDYTTMQVDPADDQTFWYIGQYLSVNGSFNWRTRIVSFRFPTTTATTTGDFNTAGNWSNGVPSATVSGIVPAGQTMTVNTPTTVYNLDVQSGGSVTMNADLTVQGSLTLGSSINTGANTLGIGCLGTVSGASSSAYVIGNVKKDFCSTGSFTFPTGSANGYSPVTSGVTTLTTNPSSLSVKAVQGNRTGMNPASSVQRYWTLSSTGSLTTDLIFNYLDSDGTGTESGYQLYRWSGSTSSAVSPFTLNSTANTMTASGITSFSDWAIGNLAPTAAGVSVSGRVLTSSGNGIRNAVVTLTDQAGTTRSAITSAFGYYRFDDVAAGQTVVIEVVSKRYQFDPRAVDVSDNVIDLDLIAQ